MAQARQLTTREVAELGRYRRQSIAESLCRNGDFLGIKPTKLPSGRLLWDEAEVLRVFSGEAPRKKAKYRGSKVKETTEAPK